ncbi:MAG: hypothetical protein CEE38_11400 [Planctomycetes bacterium B3_Pla]|nr:MAG: hypothetical protein CEE38_11400 [Planctomycetes bacterium B3_Pla]
MTANDKRIILVILSLCLASAAPGRDAPAVRWGHQLVTPTDDVARSAVADSNDSIYFTVKKQTKDASGATTSKGLFLLKYNQQGDQLWSKQLDPGVEDATGLAADDQGNIYVFGFVSSTPERETKGGHDALVAKYDQTGIQQWVWQLGTPEHDVCTGLDFDADENLYISGYTYGDFAKPNKGGADMFIAAYDKHRNLLWRDQIGTDTDDRATDIRVGDNNDIYLCGNTSGSLARQNNGFVDFVVARYERTGKSLWLYQYGTNAMDSIGCMEIGELGHLYLGCRTNGNVGSRSPQRMDWDSCLVSISKKGKLLWTRQFGTDGWDGTWDMAWFQDGSGDILISGCQIPVKSKCRGYCRRYTPEGKLIWTKEFREYNSSGGTCGRVVTIDSANNCYHGGQTHADWLGVNNGTGNVYIVRFDGAKNEEDSP